MSKLIVLHFSVPPGDDPQLLRGRLVTFQSSLFTCLRKTGWGQVDWSELDKLEPSFHVFGVRAANLKRISDWIEKEVTGHGLLVTVETRAS